MGSGIVEASALHGKHMPLALGNLAGFELVMCRTSLIEGRAS